VKKFKKFVLIFLLLDLLLMTTIASAAPGNTTRVSVGLGGVQGNGSSLSSSISADGRYVAFYSSANNLVSGDTNAVSDVFVYDRVANTTTRVSVDSGGAEGNASSAYPSISADGRYVAFHSYAANLVGGDTNGDQDIFVHDRIANTTTRISVNSSNIQGNGDSYHPSISADGRYVTFESNATNLAVGGDTNGQYDVFIRDRTFNTTVRISVDSAGNEANGDSFVSSISADGRYVAFCSEAGNLVSGDTNGALDTFLHDVVLGVTIRVSVDSFGAEGNANSGYPSVSPDGRYVAFFSTASNLVGGDTNAQDDAFIYERSTGSVTRLSVDSNGVQGNGNSYGVSTSFDGRYVAFWSFANNLVSGDTNGVPDIFVHDRNLGATMRVSVSSSGIEGNAGSGYPSLSSDGRYVAFPSDASNLVGGDTNSATDIFIHELDVDAPLVASTNLSAAYTGMGPSSFVVTFNENVNNAGGGTLTDDAANPNNYVMMEQGSVSGFQTTACNNINATQDTRVTPSGVTYIPNTAVVNFGSPLPAGTYRLFVCGTTSIVDLVGNHLNGGADMTFDFKVGATATTSSMVTSSEDRNANGRNSGNLWLPNTGFAPNVVTRLPEQPAELAYTQMSDLWLEIPSQNVKANIVGVPQSENIWDVKWLGNDAGWLNGTAFPSWEGNSVLTGHVMGADGLPGPFAKLGDLGYGERVIVHMLDQQYVFEVRNKRLVRPDSTAFALEHLEDASYLTLVTCSGYNEERNTYSFRRLVRAVLVEVK
jgi:LPXTG-site transpeptidase (sortase) family protein